jgi:hypothetical protein
MVRESPIASWTMGAWEDPHWCGGTATSRARLLDFILIRGAHAGGTVWRIADGSHVRTCYWVGRA